MWTYNQGPSGNELYHFGILGMKWGVRRYQNKDGTLTAEGKKQQQNERISRIHDMSDDEIRKVVSRLQLEKQLAELISGSNSGQSGKIDSGKKETHKVLKMVGTTLVKKVAEGAGSYLSKKIFDKAMAKQDAKAASEAANLKSDLDRRQKARDATREKAEKRSEANREKAEKRREANREKAEQRREENKAQKALLRLEKRNAAIARAATESLTEESEFRRLFETNGWW